MHQLVQQVLDFLRAHPEAAVWVVGLSAFAESFAFISFLIPGFTILVAAGAMIQAGMLNPVVAAFAGAGGALAGDIASYYLGHHAGAGIRQWRVVNKHLALFDRGEHFFARYGVLAIFIGHFLGPLRAFLPLIAGMCRMPFAIFAAVAAVSTAIWAPALLFSGFLLGRLVQNNWSLEQKGLALAGAVALFAALVWLSRRVFKAS